MAMETSQSSWHDALWTQGEGEESLGRYQRFMNDEPPEGPLNQVIVAWDDSGVFSQNVMHFRMLAQSGVHAFKYGSRIPVVNRRVVEKPDENKVSSYVLSAKLHGIAYQYVDHRIQANTAQMPNEINNVAICKPKYASINLDVGPTALERAVEFAAKHEINLVGITIDPDMPEGDCRRVNQGRSVGEVVADLSMIAAEVGIEYITCSGYEAEEAKHAGAHKVIATAIALPGQEDPDTDRYMTASQALNEGADFVVAGRALLKAPNLNDALSALADDLS